MDGRHCEFAGETTWIMNSLFSNKMYPKVSWRLGVVTLACTMFASLAGAGVSVVPVPSLVSDDFDTGNATNAAPIGWKVSAAEGTTVRVVGAGVVEPASAPHCVELRDNSPKARPEMYREFPPAEAGLADASFRVNSTSTAHMALQLRSAKGGHLCSVVFADNGMIRHEGAEGNIISATPWTPGQWQTVQIEWFSDFTYTASLGDSIVVQHARFITNALPAKVYVTVGYGTVTNRIGYVDNVKVNGVVATK